MKEDIQELPIALQGFSGEERNKIGKLQFASMLVEIISRVGNHYEACLGDLEINNLEIGLEENVDELDLILSEFQERVLKLALKSL